MFFTNNFDQVCVQRKQDKKASLLTYVVGIGISFCHLLKE